MADPDQTTEDYFKVAISRALGSRGIIPMLVFWWPVWFVVLGVVAIVETRPDPPTAAMVEAHASPEMCAAYDAWRHAAVDVSPGMERLCK